MDVADFRPGGCDACKIRDLPRWPTFTLWEAQGRDSGSICCECCEEGWRAMRFYVKRIRRDSLKLYLFCIKGTFLKVEKRVPMGLGDFKNITRCC